MRQFIMCLVAACVVGFCAAGVQAEEWVIAPSGDRTGVLDADAIEGALNAVAAGEGPGTVRLEKGHFWVSRPIQVSGFDGELVGAVKKKKCKKKECKKKGKTIIEAVRGPGGVEFGKVAVPYWDSPYWDPMEHSPIFLFEDNDGSIRIADLTVQVLIPNPRDTYLHGKGETTSLFSFFEIVGGDDFDTAFENVLTRGGKGDYNDRNVISGIHVMGGPTFNSDWSTGTHTVQNCKFENIATFTYFFGFWWASDFVVSGNSFTGVDTAIYSDNNPSTDVEISHNKFKVHPIDWYDTVAIYGDISPPVSEVLISKNEFRVSGRGWARAIYVWDPGFSYYTQKTLDVSIIDNKFQLDEAFSGGIWTDLHGALIEGNKFKGTSFYGAVVAGINKDSEGRYVPAEGLYIADNDFKKLSSVAHTIWLGQGTSECIVADNKGVGDYVLDESASASNTVILD